MISLQQENDRVVRCLNKMGPARPMRFIRLAQNIGLVGLR